MYSIFQTTHMLKIGKKKRNYYLCKKSASDEDFHDHGDDQLNDEEDYRYRTLLCDAAEPVANRSLGLQGVKEGSRQGLHLHYTRGVIRRGVKLWRRGKS